MSAVREVPLGGNIQSVLNEGPGEVLLTADRNSPYSVSSPLILPRGVNLRGANHGAIIRASVQMDAVLKVGNGSTADHWAISGLTIDANNLAATGIDVNIVGTSGNYKSGEPDSRGRISDVEIWDATTNGVWTRGTDAQAIRFQGIRVRRAGLYGFLVESADLWFTDCEATTMGGSTDANRPGAGFGIYKTNCHFKGCKAWFTRGSHGFHVKGSRNFLTDCEAQDCGKHGFFVEYAKNLLVACVADTCSTSMANGTPGTHDGFYLVPDNILALVGCLSFDRKPNGLSSGQRYGFNMPIELNASNLAIGLTGYDNLSGLFNYR